MLENKSTSQMQNDLFNNAFDKWKQGDKDNAVPLFKKLAKDGHVMAQLILCHHYYPENDIQQAIKWYKKAALSSEPNAYLSLAFLYEPSNFLNAEGIRSTFIDAVEAQNNYIRAFNGFLWRAINGYPDAMSMLADFYAGGWGIERNMEKSKYWRDQTYIFHTGKPFDEQIN
jgi:TPR repeat protein